MKITCPKCKKDNEVVLPESIPCEHCSSDLSKFKYKKLKKSVLLMLFVVGGVAGCEIDNSIASISRYPVSVEYHIIHTCTYGGDTYQNVDEPSDICICALNNTMKEIPYFEYQKYPHKFLTEFSGNVNACDDSSSDDY